ncbi:MAG: hypothetical protein R6X08_06690 [Desulfosalsimonadaceae bacterium]
MNFRIWLINFFLAALLVVCGLSILRLWESEPQPVREIASEAKKSDSDAFMKKKSSLMEDRAYELLVRQNLFSPERKEYVEKSESEGSDAESEQPKISGEQVALYGVIISDGIKTAMINNPGGKLGDKKFEWIKEGQMLSNLEVIEIHPDEVVLDDGGKRYQVLLSEKKQRKGRGKAGESSGPTVVRGGSGSKKIQSISTSSSSSSSSSSSPSSSGDASKKASGSSGSGEEKYELVDTPFGTIRKKIE